MRNVPPGIQTMSGEGGCPATSLLDLRFVAMVLAILDMPRSPMPEPTVGEASRKLSRFTEGAAYVIIPTFEGGTQAAKFFCRNASGSTARFNAIVSFISFERK